MKYLLSLLITITLVSCSHGKHSHAEEHKILENDHSQIEIDHKKISEVFRWFENHVKKHENEDKKNIEKRSPSMRKSLMALSQKIHLRQKNFSWN